MEYLFDYDCFFKHANAVLGPKEVRQFSRAVENPLTEFQKRVIEPQFYQPHEQMYLGLAVDHYLSGKNPHIAKALRNQQDAWPALTFFTNPLSIPPAPLLIEGKEEWIPPMDRVIWGQNQVMTYEFDQPDLPFFRKQLAWCRSADGKQLNCAMGKLFLACSQWVDFRGITVVYSGSKSFHIHIVFTTANAIAQGITQNVREGLKGHWHRLLNTVMAELQPNVQPDMSMWQPEKFRRFPNGIRQLDKPNIIGIPAGANVPQLTVWEKFRNRGAKGQLAMFFDPTLFVQSKKPAISRTSKQLDFLPSDAELDFCRAKMKEIYNDASLPSFHDFVQHGASIRAHFSNHAGDRKPASYMDANYQTVNINGNNPAGLTPQTTLRLPKSLGEMCADWCAEYQQINTRERTPLEQGFAMAVKDNDSARREMAKLLMLVIRDEKKMSFICAPEGISKTTGLFDNHHRISPWLAAQEAGAVMYAFADYKAAYEKAGEFNSRQSANKYRAVVLESFDHAYSSACKKLSMAAMNLQQVWASGHTSLWTAIEAIQPDVMDVLRQRHTELWAEIGDATPVFFTVHAVAHNWELSAKSRLMWARSYWTLCGQSDQTKICRDETKLSLLVHDEIRAENLVASYPSWKVDWVSAMVAKDANAWNSRSPAAVRFAAYKAFVLSSPFKDSLTYEEVQDIVGFAGHDWDRVTTSNSGEYGPLKSAYAATIGNEWSIIERSWPTDTASRTVVLTTESVPLMIARRSLHDWNIIDLDTPLLKADFVETHAQRGVTGKNLPKLCLEWRRRDTDLYIVSNKVAHLPNTMTHARARGSNQLIGKNILQTMTFVAPAEFETLEALNAWTSLNCLIRHRHIDEFNQTAGRNLGFRKCGNSRHYLLVNKALFDLLVGAPSARSRYQMRVVPNRHQRSKARIRKVGSAKGASGSRLKRMQALLRKQSAEGQFESPHALSA